MDLATPIAAVGSLQRKGMLNDEDVSSIKGALDLVSSGECGRTRPNVHEQQAKTTATMCLITPMVDLNRWRTVRLFTWKVG